MFVSAVLLLLMLGTAAATAAPVPDGADLRTARAEANALPAVPVATPATAQRAAGFDELRDCAALVLVGGMLIGLAAAVRRTA